MRMVVATAMMAAVLVSGRLRAQAPEPLPKFEAASVKPNTSPDARLRMVTEPGGRYIATNAPLKLLLADAYVGTEPLAVQRVVGGPEWVQSARYDINAKAARDFERTPGGPSREMLQMVRSLLEDRFKVKVHRETRQLPVYELVVARADGRLGPQLHPSPNDCEAIAAALRAGGTLPSRQPNEPPPCGGMRGPGSILAGGMEMAQFAAMLGVAVADAGPGGRDQARPVINKTGLAGRFTFTLRFTPEQIPTAAPPPGIAPIDPNGAGIFTALQEQLGLRLQPATAPMEVVVIDSIQQPAAD
jgi:uncharacterized protein (TIGR03435 family)